MSAALDSTNLRRAQAQARTDFNRFVMLIRKYEEVAKVPGRLTRTVKRWMSYGILGVTVLVFAAVSLTLLQVNLFQTYHRGNIWLAIFSIGILWTTLSALTKKNPERLGRVYTREEIPQLYQEADRIIAAAGAPRLDGIQLSEENNASAMVYRKFHAFGRYRHYLNLGVPLLCLLTEAECKSVIAHEFGHFTGRHGKLFGKVSTVYSTISAVMEHLGRGALGF
jgi:Zn-dependent protease with chaperone function